MSAAPRSPASQLSPTVKAWRLARLLLLQPKLARNLATLVTDGYLTETGWVRSLLAGEVVDANGDPQPWATLPYVEFIRPRLHSGWTVMEYGSGASTLFYAARVRQIWAVEHEPSFAAVLRPRLPSNAQLLTATAGTSNYADAISGCSAAPELVSVDGADRVACIRRTIECLAPQGVVVLDDAERTEYAEAHRMLVRAGFRSLEFWGLAPAWVRRKCTTVFYRTDNVLNI
ncbi:class I SAM-dependent methyltransferase [Opitutus terrae]|uniref:Methyltransferase FkbM family n=1 Tax=Opitutus terrae (strain DSM 11246 / JCM 15787 / PB90-1) TaxID=452637 RepID=B1ZVW5_OPITP|nr:FkbM family methyltransferase [Opitutus terrae]ACB75051.1 methyltransferase FkbM family [Opitutus terrae PB90-1]